jgi:glucokinase-like ROK family protein
MYLYLMKGANNRRVKSMNRLTILQYIRKYNPITKAEIADRTHLSFTTINNIIEELSSYQLICESGYEMSTGGRKPILYKLNHDRLYALGVHLSISRISVVILNLEGKSIAQYETATKSNTYQTDAILSQLISCIEDAINQSGVDRSKILGIGMGIPGPIDPFEGIVLSPPNFKGLESVPLKKIISEHFQLEVFVEKDANLIALGEYWHGAGQGKSNVFYLDADVGIGSGLIVDGKLYYGSPFGAGEVGHSTINIDGPLCNCGNYGCLEAVASGLAIVRRAGEEIRRGVETSLAAQYRLNEESVTVYSILDSANNGDPLAIQLLHESARYVGIAIGNVINLLLPEVIIIGGTLVNCYPPYFDQVKGIALNRIFASFAQNISVKQSELGMQSGVIGASTLVLEHFFNKGFNRWIGNN